MHFYPCHIRASCSAGFCYSVWRNEVFSRSIAVYQVWGAVLTNSSKEKILGTLDEIKFTTWLSLWLSTLIIQHPSVFWTGQTDKINEEVTGMTTRVSFKSSVIALISAVPPGDSILVLVLKICPFYYHKPQKYIGVNILLVPTTHSGPGETTTRQICGSSGPTERDSERNPIEHLR